MAVPESRSNHTIYINNLNEKIKKDGELGMAATLGVAVPILMIYFEFPDSPGKEEYL